MTGGALATMAAAWPASARADFLDDVRRTFQVDIPRTFEHDIPRAFGADGKPQPPVKPTKPASGGPPPGKPADAKRAPPARSPG